MTSPRHMPDNADLVYFNVRCHLAPVVADISQDSDYDPNVDRRIDAVVTFTPKYKTGEVIHAHTALPPTGFLVMPVTALIDDGYLKLRVKPDAGAAPLPGTLHGLKAKIAADTGQEPVEVDTRAALNYAPVRLLGNSTTLEIDPEHPLYYDFSFSNIKIDGKATNVQITGGTFEAPWEMDATIDLLDYMPLTPGPNAQPVVVGPQGPPGPPGPATIDVGSTTTGLPGTDASVSNSGDSLNAVFEFTIPRGDVGPQGPPGTIDLPANIEYTTNKGQPDGYTPLGADGMVPPEYLPADIGGAETMAELTDVTPVGLAVGTAADEAAARTAIGAEAAGVAITYDYFGL